MLFTGMVLALAQPVAAEVPAPQLIEAATWLVGRWEGTGMGGTVQEAWSAPHGGQMVGHFTYARDGEIVFTEILLLRPDAAGNLEMLVKHFNADFTAWEEKDEWITFEGLQQDHDDPRLIRFNGLTLEERDGTLTATVMMRGSDGEPRDVPFVMERAD